MQWKMSSWSTALVLVQSRRLRSRPQAENVRYQDTGIGKNQKYRDTAITNLESLLPPPPVGGHRCLPWKVLQAPPRPRTVLKCPIAKLG